MWSNSHIIFEICVEAVSLVKTLYLEEPFMPPPIGCAHAACPCSGPPQGPFGWSVGSHYWTFRPYIYTFKVYLQVLTSYGTPRSSHNIGTFTSSISLVFGRRGRFMMLDSKTSYIFCKHYFRLRNSVLIFSSSC